MIPDARDTFDRIPKVELHCHVEGTVRPSTVVDLARKAGHPLPVDDPRRLYRYDSLDSFLAIFWLVQETLVSREDWARIAYESIVDAAAHGLRYREMFFTPARERSLYLSSISRTTQARAPAAFLGSVTTLVSRCGTPLK